MRLAVWVGNPSSSTCSSITFNFYVHVPVSLSPINNQRSYRAADGTTRLPSTPTVEYLLRSRGNNYCDPFPSSVAFHLFFPTLFCQFLTKSALNGHQLTISLTSQAGVLTVPLKFQGIRDFVIPTPMPR